MRSKKSEICAFVSILLAFFPLLCYANSVGRLKFLKEWHIGKAEYIGYFDIDSFGKLYLPIDNEIRIFSKNGDLLRKIVMKGKEDGKFMQLILGVIVNSIGNIYAVEPDSGSIQIFTSDGKFINKWGTKVEKEKYVQLIKNGKDLKEYEFFEILNIDKDCYGNIYIVDVGQIKKFTSEGKFIFKLKAPWIKTMGVIRVDCEGNFVELNRAKGEILIYNWRLENISKIKYPRKIYKYRIFPISDITLDKAGNIYALVRGEYGLEEDILLLQIFKNKREIKLYKFDKLSHRTIFTLWFVVDEKGESLIILATLSTEENKVQDWFLQIYEIPK